MQNSTNRLLLFVSAGAFVVVLSINYARPYSKAATLLIKPPENLKHLTFGYQDLMADSLWIRVIQNFDSCGQSNTAAEHDYSKGVNLKNLPVCNYSWVYWMLKGVTDLSPRFYVPYYFGGMNLSYLVNDILGAEKIYDQGIREFPKNLGLLYSAAYHTLENVKDEKKAAELLMRAAQEGAPSYFVELAAKLFHKNNRTAFAINHLEKFIGSLPEDDTFKKRLESRLKLLKVEGEKAGKNKSQ